MVSQARGRRSCVILVRAAWPAAWFCISYAPRHMTWLVTSFGKARSVKAFSSLFANAAAAGVAGKSAHGLRKPRCRVLAEAGATAHQIAAWTGHESLSEVQRHAKAAYRKRILSGTPRKFNAILETEN